MCASGAFLATTSLHLIPVSSATAEAHLALTTIMPTPIPTMASAPTLTLIPTLTPIQTLIQAPTPIQTLTQGPQVVLQDQVSQTAPNGTLTASSTSTMSAPAANRYYFGNNNKCVPVNPLCNQYLSNGACTSCYPGYQVQGGTCILAGQNKDPFCKNWNTGGVCTGCYAGYFFNQVAGACKPFNPLCKKSSLSDGSCTDCFPGYTLRGGNCQIAFQDPNCQQFDPTKTTCLNCSARFFPDSNGKCKQVNPLCKTASNINGNCLSCYPGYVLQGTICALGSSTNSDVNCAAFVNGVCTNCSQGFYPGAQGKCTQFNPLCRNSNKLTGACLSCYPGYDLSNNNCIIGSSNSGNGDPNCKGTSNNGRCTGCYQGYYLSVQNNCVRRDPLCKDYTPAQDQCTSCYEGYTLTQGTCIISSQAPSANNDPYCIATQGAFCIECANGFFLQSSDGNCKELNPLCRTSNMTTGACTACYQGYTLSQQACIVAANVHIPYCNVVTGIACTECINGYYVKNGGCELVNVLCATYDLNTGACFSCVPGYVFQQGTCILPSMGIDPYCTFYTNSFCSECVQGYALVSYICQAIDPNCLQFDNTRNTCNSCANGRTPQGPNCV